MYAPPPNPNYAPPPPPQSLGKGGGLRAIWESHAAAGRRHACRACAAAARLPVQNKHCFQFCCTRHSQQQVILRRYCPQQVSARHAVHHSTSAEQSRQPAIRLVLACALLGRCTGGWLPNCWYTRCSEPTKQLTTRMTVTQCLVSHNWGHQRDRATKTRQMTEHGDGDIRLLMLGPGQL